MTLGLLGKRKLGFFEKADPVAVHNGFNVTFSMPFWFQQFQYLLKVGNRLKIAGRLLSAKSAVEVASNPNIRRIARKQTDMINVVDHQSGR